MIYRTKYIAKTFNLAHHHPSVVPPVVPTPHPHHEVTVIDPPHLTLHLIYLGL